MSLANYAPPKRIALVDCNNFYASCERVFRPDWEGKPIGVLSNNDGCIIARSNELKSAGIPMGAPYFKFKDRLRELDAVIVSSNYTLYGDMSSRVMTMLSHYTPHMEIYSIDEAWLDLSGINPLSLDAYGREIVSRVYQGTGIPVSMGIAPTKVLAKVANRICKKYNVPGKLFNIGSADNLNELLAAFDVGDVWGVGRKWAEKLNAQGIYSALDLRNSDENEMRKRYSIVMQRLILELRGISCLEFEEPEPKKEIMASRSFGQRVTDKADLKEAVSFHVARAAEKLRGQGSVCGALQVYIRSGFHNPRETTYSRSVLCSLSVPTSDTGRLIGAALKGVDQIYREGVRYAKAGISLLDVCQESDLQANLFQMPDTPKSQALMKSIDQINKRYGKHTMTYACQGINQSWEMKRGFKTPSYTTQWSEIPNVK